MAAQAKDSTMVPERLITKVLPGGDYVQKVELVDGGSVVIAT